MNPALKMFLVLVALVGGSGLAGFYLGRMLRMRDHAWKIFLVLFTMSSALVINQVNDWSPRLGIDLRGGAILEYQVDESKKTPGQNVEVDEIISALARRLNPGGVLEISIRQSLNASEKTASPSVFAD